MKRATAKKTTTKRGSGANPEADAGKSPKIGRPTNYTDELAEEICERLSGGEPLAHICRDDYMPAVRTVSHWKADRPTFLADFARARDEGFDAIAAECLEISNTPLEGIREKRSKDGIEVTREDMLGHRRLQIETRLKLLAKWDPKRYGDKITQDITSKVSHEISEEMQDKIIERTTAAAAIAAVVQPPASFRGEETEAPQG